MSVETRPLRELASVIRSKNAKPYRLTLDVLFERRDIFEYVRDTGALSEKAVAAAYGIAREQITSSFVFDAGMGFKFTLRRHLRCATARAAARHRHSVGRRRAAARESRGGKSADPAGVTALVADVPGVAW